MSSKKRIFSSQLNRELNVTLNEAFNYIENLPSLDYADESFIGFKNDNDNFIQFIRKSKENWLLDIPGQDPKFNDCILNLENLSTFNVKYIVTAFFNDDFLISRIFSQFILKESLEYSDNWKYFKIDPKFLESLNEQTSSTYEKSVERNSENQKKDLVIFISYTTANSLQFQIVNVVKMLEKRPLIKKIHCWELWSGYPDGNIIDFMNNGISECDVFIPFFTEAYNNSSNCRKEYSSADAINKRIIPIYDDFNQVPPLCRAKKGIHYFSMDIRDFVEEIYKLILAIV